MLRLSVQAEFTLLLLILAGDAHGRSVFAHDRFSSSGRVVSAHAHLSTTTAAFPDKAPRSSVAQNNPEAAGDAQKS